ncbi:MAG: MATE family efflux transporter [Bacteroidota bacterium]|nr:MATE family efflux transporter [Bacteroidota bacterium]MDP3144189.1 MATE family efflux transporter [Bacteroidota bacterium]
MILLSLRAVMIKSFFKNHHTKQTIYLAWPLVITQVGHIITGMVDTIFLGKIGPTEQAACILSNNLYVLLMVFGIGVSYATTPLVTDAHHNNDLLKKASLFKNSLFINLAIAVVCFVILFLSSGVLKHMQQPAEVVDLAVPFFDVLIFSMIPISLFFTCKQYCEGLMNTRMALIISVVGNLLNIVLNYVLIYGKFGFPELGYLGSAWASFIARAFMGISFLVFIFKSPLTKEIGLVYKQVKINWVELKDLARIGLNSGAQFTFEVAAFVIAGLMAGTFGKEQIDAHGIALSIAAFTYMFASGISSAATIRVGVYKAQQNWVEIKNAGFTAIKLVFIVMGFFGLLFLSLSSVLPMAFSSEVVIIEQASKLLIIAAMFQLFDGIQVVAIGALRGLEDVKYPTIITLVGYWLIALPLAYFLAFNLKLETIGIWFGLLAALTFVAIALFWRFNFLVKKNLVGKS